MAEMTGHERFIVFEGIDGAGTTTQTNLLKGWLEARGEKVVTTCEPSQGPFGSMVRNALKRRIVVPTIGDGPDADRQPQKRQSGEAHRQRAHDAAHRVDGRHPSHADCRQPRIVQHQPIRQGEQRARAHRRQQHQHEVGGKILPQPAPECHR